MTSALPAPDSPRDTPPRLARWLPLAALALALAAAVFWFWPRPGNSGAYDLGTFRALPVLYEGRIMPYESVARTALLTLRGRQSISLDGHSVDPMAWLLDTLARPDIGQTYPVFRIDDPDVRSLLDPRDDKQVYFSFNEILAHREQLGQQITQAQARPDSERNLYQKHLVDLDSQIATFVGLAQLATAYPLPPDAQHPQWQSVEDLAAAHKKAGAAPGPAFTLFGSIIMGWNEQNPQKFNRSVQGFAQLLAQTQPQAVEHARIEAALVRAEPFIFAMEVYVAVFLIVCISWLVKGPWARGLLTAAFALAILALLVHTTALGVRMYLQGRPPVTNLYASAIFVGWGSVVLALILEAIYRNGVGAQIAGVIGFLSLIVAHHLASGDTMEAVRAVLDSNFWLSTHVVTITIGYASTFLAGFLGILYIVRRLIPGSLDEETGQSIARMIYGIVCFAMLFSFVGTILGGIWADQSWGRFWGWDVKENGALMIVLWNAIILHARWGKMIRQRGLAVLAVGGNIITAWAWFGVNMLGVGLHSYGFMQKALWWLGVFVASQLVIMGLGLIEMAPAEPVKEPTGPDEPRGRLADAGGG